MYIFVEWGLPTHQTNLGNFSMLDSMHPEPCYASGPITLPSRDGSSFGPQSAWDSYWHALRSKALHGPSPSPGRNQLGTGPSPK